MTLRNMALGLIVIISIGFVLVVGKSLLIQLIFALLFWFLIRGIRNRLMKIPYVGTIVPRWIWTTLSVTLLFSIFYILLSTVLGSLTSLESNTAVYTENAKTFSQEVKLMLGFSIAKMIPNLLEVDFLTSLISQAAGILTNALSTIFMVVLYAAFMFSEETNFSEKLTNVIGKDEKRIEIQNALAEIDSSIMHFLSLKTSVGLLTGALSYIILLIFEIDAALFWAFLIFLFNYIPIIGSLVATFIPAIFAIFQYGDFYHPLIVFGLIQLVQLIIGNIVEPRVMGKSLNLSSLVVIVSLSFWSVLWGIPGAFLSIPLTVVIVIVLKQFKTTLPIAKSLTVKGRID